MAEETPKGKKKHLHQVITESVHDAKGKHTGYVHHHVYKEKATDHHAEGPAKPMAVSDTAEEAGEHVQGQFAAQEGGAAGSGEAEPGPEAQGAAPAAGAGAAEPGM